MVVGDIVKSNARVFPNKTALIDDTTNLTWWQLNSRVNQLASALLRTGLGHGDRVAIVAQNCHEYVEFLFAIAKAGLVTVCMNYRLQPAQMARVLNDCEPRVLIIQDAFAPLKALKHHVKSVQHIIGIGKEHFVDIDYETFIAGASSAEPSIPVKGSDLFRIQYTTGTTGTSKGAMLTHSNEIANCLMRLQATPTWRDDIVLNTMPLFATGHQARVFGNAFLGCTQVISVFSPSKWVDAVAKHHVTYASLLPSTTFNMVREYIAGLPQRPDMSSLCKMQPEGGQHCSGSALKTMLDYFSIPYGNACKAYGGTEFMPGAYLVPEDIAAGLRPDATEKEIHRLESDGKPLMDGEMRIVDDEDRVVPPGQTGEIIFRGDQVTTGYWRQPALSARAIRDGWFHTSDLGHVDEDGYLYFEGRKDFVIKTGGLLVGPEEVEAVLSRHPAVSEAAIIGIPDEKWGQTVSAIIVLKPGATATVSELRAFCRQNLADYQVPKAVEFVKSLPRDHAFGKLDRKALIREFGGGH